MRLARVLSANAREPILALERDGALYSVSALEKWYVTAFSPDTFATSSDFRARVVALGGAGLRDLDERLASGVRPADALLAEGSFLWLPPVDDERAMLVEVDVFQASREGSPPVSLGSARSLLGHRTGASLAAGTTQARCSAYLAVTLLEDLASATAREAERALFGATPLLRWHAGARAGAELAAHLGPVLVHNPRFDPAEALGVLRIGETTHDLAPLASAPFDLAEAVAAASHRLPLRAGDVVALGPLPARTDPAQRLFEVALGQTASFQIEGLGALDGRPVASTRPAAWRRPA